MHDHLETPYFLIDEQELQSNLNQLEEALQKHWGNSLIGYSFKTNGLPWLLNYFKRRGIYAEVVSDDEYELAKKLGYKKEKIIYNGVAKSKETFFEAVKNGCIVNVDSQRELDWLRELDRSSGENFEVGIRVNFDLERACPNETVMGKEGGRFGFCYENGDLKKAIVKVNALKTIRLTGLHLHCSTKTRSLNIYRAISKMACEITQKYSLKLKYVDVGGGFFGGLRDKPQFDEYIEVISSELSKVFNNKDTVLIVEPGTSIVSSPFNFVTSVVDLKQTSTNHFVTTDGSNININPMKNKGIKFFRIQYKNSDDRNLINKQVISGFTCMEDDRIMVLEDAPQVMVGDQIIYENVGAYSMSLSPLFIKFFPAVYVEKDGVMMEAREKWTVDHYL